MANADAGAEENELEGAMLLQESADARARERKSALHWAREGGLDYALAVPITVLILLAVAAVVYNLVRPPYVPCDPNKPLAKHFYCYNLSRPPGVHEDTH